jgi:hypothetical protein
LYLSKLVCLSQSVTSYITWQGLNLPYYSPLMGSTLRLSFYPCPLVEMADREKHSSLQR